MFFLRMGLGSIFNCYSASNGQQSKTELLSPTQRPSYKTLINMDRLNSTYQKIILTLHHIVKQTVQIIKANLLLYM